MSVKVVFYMLVYNTKEEYLRKAIESVLNQTCGDLLFFIQDNGSTDKTKDILKEYSKKDERIILFRNEQNCNPTNEEYLYRQRLFEDKIKKSGAEYFAIIDSDDYYENNFVEESYKNAKQNNAELVIYGHKNINEEDTMILSSRIPERFNSIDCRITDDKFIKLYSFFRTVWGKLYSMKLWDDYWYLMDVDRPPKLKNGADTYLIFSLMMIIRKYVSIDKTFYNYRVRKGSIYDNDVSTYRIKEPTILYSKAFEFIKASEICSDKSIEFLANVYFQSIYDLIYIVLKSTNMNFSDKIIYIRNILDEELLNVFLKKNIAFMYDIINKLIQYLQKKSLNQRKEAALLINHKNSNVVIKLKRKLLEYIDNGDIENANILINELLIEQPLSEDVLYFKIYMDKIKGIECETIINLAKNVYSDSEEIMNLIR